jgi:hypothetical protein
MPDFTQELNNIARNIHNCVTDFEKRNPGVKIRIDTEVRELPGLQGVREAYAYHISAVHTFNS